jgi:hypothetical protein
VFVREKLLFAREAKSLPIEYGTVSYPTWPDSIFPHKHLATVSSKSLPKWSKVLPSRVGSWPYPQTLDQAAKVYQGQTLKLILRLRQ